MCVSAHTRNTPRAPHLYFIVSQSHILTNPRRRGWGGWRWRGSRNKLKLTVIVFAAIDVHQRDIRFIKLGNVYLCPATTKSRVRYNSQSRFRYLGASEIFTRGWDRTGGTERVFSLFFAFENFFSIFSVSFLVLPPLKTTAFAIIAANDQNESNLLRSRRLYDKLHAT